jgi:plasmid maintenance system killer protein
MILYFRHKGLKHLHEDGNAKGVPSAMADKLRKLLFALETAEALQQLGTFPAGACILSKATGENRGA